MQMSNFKNFVLIEKFIVLMMLAYPSLMITVKGGMNGVFILMLILSAAVLIIGCGRKTSTPLPAGWEQYIVAMVSLPIAVLLSQSYHNHFVTHSYDAPFRFLLAVPILMLLRHVRFEVVAMVQYGFPIGAIVGLLMADNVEGGRLATLYFLDLIHFGDFELLLGVLSVLCIDWSGKEGMTLRALKIIGLLAGIYASFKSGSRGGWIAIPVFMGIIMYFFARRISWRSMVLAFLALVTAGYLIFTFNSLVKQRTSQLVTDVVTFDQDNRDTSTGIRWQLYKAAMDVFLHHPIFGVGPEGFALEMKPMAEAGKITPTAAELGRGEVHNDILSKAAGMGIFGLVAILAVYFVPFRLFWRATKSASEQVKRAGILGIVFVSGFFIFGLTVEFLNLTMATAFYGFTVAVLLAACYNIHHGEQLTSINPDKDNHHV